MPMTKGEQPESYSRYFDILVTTLTYCFVCAYGDGVLVGGNKIGCVAVGGDVFDGTGVFVIGAGVVGVLVIKRVGTAVLVKKGTDVKTISEVGITKGVIVAPGVFVRIISVTMSDGSVNASSVTLIGVLDGIAEGVGVSCAPPPL